MKKNIFILAVVAMFVSANVMAQTTPAKAETKKECCKTEKKECCKTNKKDCAKGETKKCDKGEKKACCDKKAETKKK